MIDLDLVAQHRPHVQSMTPSEQDDLFARVFARHRAPLSIESDPTVDELRVFPSEPQSVLPSRGRLVLTLAAGTLVVVGTIGAVWVAGRNDPTPSPQSASSNPTLTSDADEPAVSQETSPLATLPEVPTVTTTAVPYEQAQSEFEVAAASFEDRRTIALERSADGTPQWWATTWTETPERGPEIVCLGFLTFTTCHEDGTNELDGQPVLLLSSGETPINGAVILVEAGVTDLAVTLPDVDSRDLASVDLGTTSGRSLAGFGLADEDTYATITGTFAGKPFEQVVEFALPPPIFEVEGLDVPVERFVPDIASVEHRPTELS